MEFFTILGIIWVVVTVADWMLAGWASRKVREEVTEQVAERIREVKLEHLEDNHNTILAYDAENHRFLGQAATIDQLKEIVMDRFPEHIFIIEGKVFSKLEANLASQINERI